MFFKKKFNIKNTIIEDIYKLYGDNTLIPLHLHLNENEKYSCENVLHKFYMKINNKYIILYNTKTNCTYYTPLIKCKYIDNSSISVKFKHTKNTYYNFIFNCDTFNNSILKNCNEQDNWFSLKYYVNGHYVDMYYISKNITDKVIKLQSSINDDKFKKFNIYKN